MKLKLLLYDLDKNVNLKWGKHFPTFSQNSSVLYWRRISFDVSRFNRSRFQCRNKDSKCLKTFTVCVMVHFILTSFCWIGTHTHTVLYRSWIGHARVMSVFSPPTGRALVTQWCWGQHSVLMGDCLVELKSC